jgi:glycosyltransferase involved in cell wall biosynthesis
MAIGRLPGKAAIYTEHSTTNRRRNSGLLRLVDYWAYDRYARIVCISQGVKQRLVGHLGGIGQKAVVIHNGIDLGRFTAGSAPGKLVVCVANLLPYKGQEVLLRALSLLPEEVRVELAGRGPLEQRLRELAAELGLRERVRFLGYVQEVTTLYRTASICVVPSLWEGFSLAAVEAMASGVPVVASGVPGLAEVVGEAGLLFEAGNPQDLAEKISALLCSPELWAEKRAQGLERAREFSIERTAGEYCRLYAEVAGARS